MMNASNQTSPGLSSPPFVGHSINSVARVIFCTLGATMILCGVTGSGLLITVIFRRLRQKHHVHDLLLASLTLADFLNLGYWLTFLVLDLILGFHPVVNRSHCVANALICCALNIVGISSLVFISLNRYLHVCHTQRCQRFFTWSRTVLLLAGLWVSSVFIALPPVLGFGRDSYEYSSLTHVCLFKQGAFSYSKAGTIFSTFVPMMLIAFCNLAIFRFWKNTRLNLKKWSKHGKKPVVARGEECGKRSKDVELADMAKWEGERNSRIPRQGPRVCVDASGEPVKSTLDNCHDESLTCETDVEPVVTGNPRIIVSSYDGDKTNNERGIGVKLPCSWIDGQSAQQSDRRGSFLDKVCRVQDELSRRLKNIPVLAAENDSLGSRGKTPGLEKMPVTETLQPPAVVNNKSPVTETLQPPAVVNNKSPVTETLQPPAIVNSKSLSSSPESQQSDRRGSFLDKVCRVQDELSRRLENIPVLAAENDSLGSRGKTPGLEKMPVTETLQPPAVVNNKSPVTETLQPPAVVNNKSPVTETLQPPAIVNSKSLSSSPESTLRRAQRPRSVLTDPAKQMLTTAARNAQLKKKKQNAREAAFVRSLFVVFLLTFCTFLPFTIINVINISVAVPAEVNILGLLVLYMNNSVNWVVYGVMNPSFRTAYSKCGRQLLALCCLWRQPPETASPKASSQTSGTPATVQTVNTDGHTDQTAQAAQPP